MTDRKKKIIYWALFALGTALLVAAFVVGLIGIVKDIDILIHVSIILVPCGSLVNIVNSLVFGKR